MKGYTLIFLAICLITTGFASDRKKPPIGAPIPSEPSEPPSERVKEQLKARGYNFSNIKPNRFVIKKKEHYGFINDSGEVVIFPIFEKAKDFSDEVAAVQLTGKWGYIDTAGYTWLDYQYVEAGNFEGGFAKVKFSEKENKSELENTLRSFFFSNDDYEYAFIDKYGSIIVPAKTYKYVGNKGISSVFADVILEERDLAHSGKIFNDGLAYVGKEIKKETVKYGFINKTGTLVIDCIYDDVFSFQNGLARVKKDKKWGIINTNNKWVVKPEYDFIGAFSEGLALFEKDGQYGYMNTKGEIVIEPKFSDGQYFSEGLARVKINDNSGYSYIDKTGNIVFSLSPNIEKAEAFSDGRARIRIGRRYGYIDKLGNIVIKPQFQLAEHFTDGVAVVGDIIEGDTTRIYDNPFSTISFSDKYQYGLIDKNGKYIVSKKFELIGTFIDGIALVKLNGKYGYIKQDGSYLVEPRYENAHSFKNGLAEVNLNGKQAYIDKTGRVVWQQE